MTHASFAPPPSRGRPQILRENKEAAFLVNEALHYGDGEKSLHGALVVKTGQHTGRAAQDKFIVQNHSTYGTVSWNGATKPLEVEGVGSGILDPRSTWADPNQYDAAARKLVRLFADDFCQFQDSVSVGVLSSTPKVDVG